MTFIYTNFSISFWVWFFWFFYSDVCVFSEQFPGSEQSKQIVFAPSVEPTFVNVPQNNFVEPFVLNPGTWTVVIEAEGILLVRQIICL